MLVGKHRLGEIPPGLLLFPTHESRASTPDQVRDKACRTYAGEGRFNTPRAPGPRSAAIFFCPTVRARQAALRADEVDPTSRRACSSPASARVTPAQSAEQGTPRRTCGTPRRTPARRTPAVGCPNQPDVVPRPASLHLTSPRRGEVGGRRPPGEGGTILKIKQRPRPPP